MAIRDHPAQGLKDSGCSLVDSRFSPQPETVTSVLRSIGFDGQFPVSQGEAPRLVAHIQTPGGVRRLG